MSSDIEQWILPDHGFVHAKHRTTHLNGTPLVTEKLAFQDVASVVEEVSDTIASTRKVSGNSSSQMCALPCRCNDVPWTPTSLKIVTFWSYASCSLA